MVSITWFSILIKVLTSETVDFVLFGVGGVEADVYPTSADIHPFGFKTYGVEVDGAHFLTSVKVHDMEPVVARAVAIGQIGMAVLDFAPLRHLYAGDGYGPYHIRVGEVHLCGFGCHMEKPGEGRFERLKETHPKVYDYIMRPVEQGGLDFKTVIDWINNNGGTSIKY